MSHFIHNILLINFRFNIGLLVYPNSPPQNLTLTPTIAVCVCQKRLIVTLYTTAEIFRIHLVLSLRKLSQVIMMTRLLFLLWILCSMLITFSSCRNLCSRIFFQNINEETMTYKIIEGVYTKENNNHNNFPVYRRENGNLLFYYYISKEGLKFLSFGLNLKHYIGVAAEVYSAVDPVSWLNSGSLDRSDVFGGLIYNWQFYNTRDKTHYYVAANNSSPIIKAVCVDEDFTECNSDRLYMNVNFTDRWGNVLNDHTRDYFFRKQGVFRYLRPLYEHSRQTWYLQYTADGFWVVTERYSPTNSNDNDLMKTKDFALRPEYISKTWSVHYNGWRYMPKLRVLCRGVNSMSNTCLSKPCHSKATCIYTSGNETLCLCPSGYTGVTCSTNKQCPTPYPLSGTEMNFAYPGKRPGDLGFSFCSGSYPSVRFAVCVESKYRVNPYWSRQGSACRKGNTGSTSSPRTPWYTQTTERFWTPWNPRTSWKSPTPRARRVNFDDNPVITPVVLTSAVILELLLPFIIYCCAVCKKKCKEDREEQEDQRRLQEVGGELERRLEQVARAGSRVELDRDAQDYQRAVQEYQRENEDKELSRKKGLYKNSSLWRIICMHLFFSFYLWIVYLVGCEISQCTQYGRIFASLKNFGIVMLCLSSVYIFIESIFSLELDYLRNIMKDETAWGYIQKMHQVVPRIGMVVECYHFEMRTRDVYYKDASGNPQSRTETYTEKVVTFEDHDEFSFGSWVDISKRKMPALSSVSLTRVRIDPYVLFGDQETADDYERQATVMIERNRHRDAFTDFSASREIPGLKKRISAYVDLRVKPWWIRPLFFWLATLLQMTWPYRWLFRAKTSKSYYALKKMIYKSTTPPPEVNLMDQIAMLAGDLNCNDSGVPENNQISYEMGEMLNPGLGNSAYQNDLAPHPPSNPAMGPSCPPAPEPSAPPESYVTGTPYPLLNAPNASASPVYIPYPAGGPTYPSQPLQGPAYPPYFVRPQPDAPPLLPHEGAVGYTPQAQ